MSLPPGVRTLLALAILTVAATTAGVFLAPIRKAK